MIDNLEQKIGDTLKKIPFKVKIATAGVALMTGLGMYMCSSPKQEVERWEEYNPPRTVEREEYNQPKERVKEDCESILKDQYTSIDNFNNNVNLIITANNDETIAVKKTLKNRNRKYKKEARFNFEDKGKYTKVTMPVRIKGDLKNTYTHIVNQKDFENFSKEMKKHNIKYSIVQLRGHDREMHELYAKINNDKILSEYNITILGGCNSYDLAKNLTTDKRLVIGGYGEQNSSNNTHLFLQYVNTLKNGNVDDWDQFNRRVSRNNNLYDKTFFHPTKVANEKYLECRRNN